MEVKCIYCGQMNGDDALVCIGCGRTLPPGTTPPQPDTTESWGATPESPPSIWTPGGPPPWAPTPSPPPPPQFVQPPYGHPAPPWPGSGSWQAHAESYGQLPAEVVQAQSHAKLAMFLAIFGFACCQIPGGPVALYFGLKSRATLLHYGIENGQGMAMAGIVLGTVDTIMGILTILALLAK